MNWDNAKHVTVGNRNAVRISINDEVVWTGLPAGFTRLTYIETTGEQYIDTGFTPNQDSRIVCQIRWLGGMNGFGARYTVDSRNFSIRVVNDRWQLGFNDGVSPGTILAEKAWQTLDINKNKLYVDGVLSVSREYAAFTVPHPIALGAIRASSLYYGTARYKACQIYDDGFLVRDMIPCRSPAGKLGMYDTVNAVFYGNSGTGEFVAGEEV